MIRYFCFILFGSIFLFSSCKQHNASSFYKEIHNVYSEHEEQVRAFLTQKITLNTLKSDLDKSIIKVNNVADFKEGEAFKTIILKDLELWSRIIDIAVKLQNGQLSRAETAALNAERSRLAIERITAEQRVHGENLRFAEKFDLEPIGELFLIKHK